MSTIRPAPRCSGVALARIVQVVPPDANVLVIRMTDRATPNLPSTDLDATAAFYERFGFERGFVDEGWLILTRGPIELEFFLLRWTHELR